MLGLLWFCLVIAVILAEKTKEIQWSKKNKKDAQLRGNKYYIDSQGRTRMVDTDEPVFIRHIGAGRVIYSVKTSKMIDDEYDTGPGSWNKKLDPYMKGHYDYVYSDPLKLNYPTKRIIFYFDNVTNRPYILLQKIPALKGKDRETKFYKCYFKNNIVPDWMDREHLPKTFLDLEYSRDPNLDYNTMIEITKEVYWCYDLDRSWLVTQKRKEGIL